MIDLAQETLFLVSAFFVGSIFRNLSAVDKACLYELLSF
jgi:hypothetical protein